MRTSIDFSESLLREAKALSKQQHVSLKTLAEEGLRLAIDHRRAAKQRRPFHMVTFGNPGDKDQDLSWDRIRSIVYPPEFP
jgi:hypothetical protein